MGLLRPGELEDVPRPVLKLDIAKIFSNILTYQAAKVGCQGVGGVNIRGCQGVGGFNIPGRHGVGSFNIPGGQRVGGFNIPGRTRVWGA